MTTSKTMFFPVFLCMVSLLAIPTHQAPVLVTSTCEKTLYKSYCNFALGSASANDLPSLTKFTLKLAASKGFEIRGKIDEILKTSTDANIKRTLTDCSDTYKDAVDQIGQSVPAVDAKGYSDVNTWVSAAMTDADTCEEGFKEMKGIESPLTDLSTRFSQLCSIILTMSNLLAQH